jgi:carboxypeptidase PM20D1
MSAVARDVYRFQPIVASLREFEMIHGTDEHLTLANLERLVDFYTRLIGSAAAAHAGTATIATHVSGAGR